MEGRLYRSRTNSMVAGVCGGLGQYLRIDSTLVRLFFILLALGSGVGVVAYLLLWVLIPREGQGEAGSPETVRSGAEEIAERARTLGGDLGRNLSSPDPRALALIGIALVVLGGVFLLKALDLPWLHWLSFDALWPLLLIAAGVVLIWRRAKGD